MARPAPVYGSSTNNNHPLKGIDWRVFFSWVFFVRISQTPRCIEANKKMAALWAGVVPVCLQCWMAGTSVASMNPTSCKILSLYGAARRKERLTVKLILIRTERLFWVVKKMTYEMTTKYIYNIM